MVQEDFEGVLDKKTHQFLLQYSDKSWKETGVLMSQRYIKEIEDGRVSSWIDLETVDMNQLDRRYPEMKALMILSNCVLKCSLELPLLLRSLLDFVGELHFPFLHGCEFGKIMRVIGGVS